MKNLKITYLITYSCLIAVPSLAVEQPKNVPDSRITQPKTPPTKEEVQTSFDKKTFIEQVETSPEFIGNNNRKKIDLSATFDLLDKNHNGKVDSKELQQHYDNDVDDNDNDTDDDISYATDQPLKNTQSTNSSSETAKTGEQTSDGTGIPPINADQLLK